MVKQLSLLIFLSLFFASFSFKKKKKFHPPGTVKINDTLYADETEVTNFSWREYELWIKEKYGFRSPEHIASLPDTMVWRDKEAYNGPYVAYYYRHPAYKDYPVVGVSYEQVCAFIEWRIERIKEYMCISGKYGIVDFEYRLPSKKEWEFLSNNGNNLFKNGGRNEKGLMTFNHVWEPKDSVGKKMLIDGYEGYMADNADVTAPVYSYWPNKFKLWNMIGNVSEMVLERGISKGGSWRHRLEQCRAGNDIHYEKPTAWLGFRCVCIVKKSKAT